MTVMKNVARQTADTKKRDAEEMIKLFSKMSERERAMVFGFVQGVESMIEEAPDKRSA